MSSRDREANARPAPEQQRQPGPAVDPGRVTLTERLSSRPDDGAASEPPQHLLARCADVERCAAEALEQLVSAIDTRDLPAAALRRGFVAQWRSTLGFCATECRRSASEHDAAAADLEVRAQTMTELAARCDAVTTQVPALDANDQSALMLGLAPSPEAQSLAESQGWRVPQGDTPPARMPRAEDEQRSDGAAPAVPWERTGTRVDLPHREHLESMFGQDLTSVRAHVGASDLGAPDARAAASGDSVGFRDTTPDAALVAHEVTHVVQARQSQGPSAPAFRRDASSRGDDAEREAREIEGLVAAGVAGPVAVRAAPSAAVHFARDDDEVDWRATADRRIDDAIGSASVRLKYVGGGGLVAGTAYMGDPNDLPRVDYMLRQIERLRALEDTLAMAAARSVADRPEMLAHPAFEAKDGATEIELPASYIQVPPTDEVMLFIAVHEAIALVTLLIAEKLRAIDAATERIYPDGQTETEQEHEDRVFAEAVLATLEGLTGSVGGSIGYGIGVLLTDDPSKVAAITQAGDNAVGAFGDAAALRAPKRQRRSGRRRQRQREANRTSSRSGKSRPKRKSPNLPAESDLVVDMDHIAERHIEGGRLIHGRDVFPTGMTREQVERAIREAYRGAKKVKSQTGGQLKLQGEAAGMVIEMYVNTVTKEIETAYPVRRDRR